MPKQPENWTLIQRQNEQGILFIVRVLAAIEEFVKNHNKENLFVLSYQYSSEQRGANGMANREGQTYTYDVEDRFFGEGKELPGKTILLAVISGNYLRDFVFLTDSPEELNENLFKPLKAENNNWVSQQTSPKKYGLPGFFPTTLENGISHQTNGDNLLIDSLEKNGDLREIERPIDYWFLGKEKNLERTLQALGKEGFEKVSFEKSKLVLRKIGTTTDDDIAGTRLLLVKTALDCAVEYDGWETPIIKEEPKTDGSKGFMGSIKSLFGKDK